MRILVPLPFGVGRIQHGRNLRIVHLLRELAGRHEITCAAADETIARDSQPTLPGVNVIAAPVRPARHHATGATLRGSWPLLRAAAFFGYDPVMHAWVDGLSADADVVLGFDLLSALYLAHIGQAIGRAIPTVADLIDDPWQTWCSGHLQDRWSVHGVKTAVATHLLRERVLSQIEVLVAVAAGDAESLFQATGRPVRVVPNGVEIPTISARRNAERKPLVVFTGAMNFPPNEHAALYLVHRIWPRIHRAVPQARLALVGAEPGPVVRSLATKPGVQVTGRVDDVGYWLRQARVAVAPMVSGSGMKNKILEAGANACPVIATPLATAGFPTGSLQGVLVADTAATFAAQAIRLLNDTGAATQIGDAGQAMVRHRFTWPAAAQAMEAVLQACVLRTNNAGRHALDRLGETADAHPPAPAGARKEATHAVP